MDPIACWIMLLVTAIFNRCTLKFKKNFVSKKNHSLFSPNASMFCFHVKRDTAVDYYVTFPTQL